jgi:flotillin
VATQVEAIKNLKIDKVTVWDSGTGESGKSSTAGFVSGLLKSLPPINDLYEMAGLKMPEVVAPKPAEKEQSDKKVQAEKKSETLPAGKENSAKEKNEEKK